MYVHDEKKLCFLASPRTASRAWRDSLLHLGFRRVGAHHTGPSDGFDVSGYHTFCLVRNHWDTVLSWWFYRHGPKYESAPSLDWISRHATVNSYMSRKGLFHHAPYCDTVLKFESIATAYRDFLQTFEFKEVPPLLHTGRSLARHNRTYHQYFNPEVRRFVEWAWAEEIEKFGYQFNEV